MDTPNEEGTHVELVFDSQGHVRLQFVYVCIPGDTGVIHGLDNFLQRIRVPLGGFSL